MSRPRLRTTTGCTMCRKRRKKCCETRPICSSCRRRGLPCFWSRLPDGRAREEAEIVLTGGSDHTECFNIISTALQTARRLPALSTTFNNALDEHVVASATCDGWNTTFARLALDPQWRQLSRLDHELARLEHLPVCRVIALWITRVVSKVSRAIFDKDRT